MTMANHRHFFAAAALSTFAETAGLRVKTMTLKIKTTTTKTTVRDG